MTAPPGLDGLTVTVAVTDPLLTVTVASVVAATVPTGGVTVNVYVVLAVGVTMTGVPLVTAMFPGVIMPVPPVNAAVRLELLPEATVEGLAEKLEITGTGSTVTVAVAVTAVPLEGVTVSV